MSYCLNPNCSDRYNAKDFQYCQSCGSTLIIKEKYRLIRPLRKLSGPHQTEIFEADDGGTLKTIKVLTNHRRRYVQLFEQERQILEHLSDLAISRCYDYFTFVPTNSRQKLRCLVMERVEGKNLQQWLKTNGKLTETLAIDWLKQLLLILQQVHQEFIIHRDLKPSNIMIRPDGKLILIDFGTARKLTTTYVEKLDECDITKICSIGYTAPEQKKGQAVIRSDLFGLGRTFVHLMTGIHPNDLPQSEPEQLDWHRFAPQISQVLKNIIDCLLLPCPSARLRESEVLHQLERLDRNKNNRIRFVSGGWQKKASIVLISSTAIACLIIVIRYLGWLQPLELHAYDRLMQLRPTETQDERLLVITVDEADIQYQNQQNMSLRWSLSDRALAQLLTKIEPYKPRTIGIDIYRDFAADSNYPDLARQFQTSDRLYAVCKVPAPQDGTPKATPPPPEIPSVRIGFSDFVADNEDIIRRQLLHLTPPTTSSCQAEYAFSLEMAMDYLRRSGIESNINDAGYLQIGETVFKPIDKHSGGYQKVDDAGYQIMLNYRALESPKNIAPRISLKDVLSDRLDSQLENLIKDRLIIIGVTASSSFDDWQTPYSQQSSSAQKQTPGVFIQTQMTSQIISAAMDERPLIWWWSNFWESVWILGWSLIGGTIGWYLRRRLWFMGVAIAVSLMCLFLCCWLIWLNAGWIPFVPAAIALMFASVATVLSFKWILGISPI